MNKYSLKNGMVAKIRKGKCYLVCGNKLLNKTGYLLLTDYDNDLTHKMNEEYSIDTIFKQIYKLEDLEDIQELSVLWERIERKKMTLAEIEEKLGYSIELIMEE